MMKPHLLPGWLTLAAACSLVSLTAVRAQETSSTTTTTTTTTVPDQVPADGAAVIVQPTPVVVERVAGQHVVEIELAVSKGSVQAYFGRAPRGEKLQVGSAELNFKLPTTATVTKIASRDGDSSGSHKVTPDHPWRVSVPFSGPGRFVFNISDWGDDPVVTAAVVRVDGVVMFSGRGSEDDLNGWAQHAYGPGVRKTGSREIAFVLGDE